MLWMVAGISPFQGFFNVFRNAISIISLIRAGRPAPGLGPDLEGISAFKNIPVNCLPETSGPEGPCLLSYPGCLWTVPADFGAYPSSPLTLFPNGIGLRPPLRKISATGGFKSGHPVRAASSSTCSQDPGLPLMEGMRAVC